MHSKRPKVGRPALSLLVLVSLSLLGSATGPVAQGPPRVEKAAAVETYQGTPVGFTADGHPFRGKPDAPLTLVEYTDYVCPFCERHFSQTMPALLEKYVRTGQVKFVVQDFPLVSLHPTAPRGATATLCVAEQGASRFWQMHDALFQAQQQWSRLADPTAFLAATAGKVGADMPAYERCMASGRHDARVQQRAAAAQALGFTGTPTFQFVRQTSGKTYTLAGAQPVNVFTTWIDALLAGKEPPETTKREKPQLPPWAKPEGLAPDPKRPGFTVAGDPYKGKPGAKLVVVEFADFECPSCRRHALETQPALEKRFVETGEVMWVAKHFPLGIHPRAPVAAAAAVCAGDQGKFWEMHHALFEGVEQWSSGSDPDAALLQLAGGLKLDRAQFATCLASRRALEHVLRGLYDGQSVGVRNSPTFILVQGDTATAVVGTRSAEQFESLLKQQLDKAQPATKAEAAGSGSVVRR
jgi:protein-disulfide isomerase